ncbi:uncharacterized protein LOC142318288 [Lycorma delicatula]|uniref:uncharacterized protein LOC142318288 n=1 Tax=Lycorma delicatula TaxID=130591 RepID=UPI003F50F64C
MKDSHVNVVSKSWKHCLNIATLNLCFKQRSLLALDNLVKSDDTIIFPGDMISLVKNQRNSSNPRRILSETDLEKYLPKDIKLQEKTLDLLLESAFSKFLSGRSIQIRFPHATTDYWHSTEESRADKKKGNNGFVMGAMMAGMMMVPAALAGIGMLAGKSLLVSLLALMMSVLLASKKSGDEKGGSSYEVISIPAGGGHHHHGRSLPVAHELAFNAYLSNNQQIGSE